jgi:hypothetical protein
MDEKTPIHEGGLNHDAIERATLAQRALSLEESVRTMGRRSLYNAHAAQNTRLQNLAGKFAWYHHMKI